MIDIIVKESMDAITSIKVAEKNIKDQKYAYGRLLDASRHLNTLMYIDKHMYKLLCEEYERVNNIYLKIYNEKVINNDSNK